MPHTRPTPPRYFASIASLVWVSASTDNRADAEMQARQRAKLVGVAELHVIDRWPRLGRVWATIALVSADGKVQPFLFPVVAGTAQPTSSPPTT